MDLSWFFRGLAVGGIGGAVSGMLGVGSGGILVPWLVIVLGLEQHMAQQVSLVAQILPTGLPGLLHYGKKGHKVPRSWIVLIAAGFLVGGYVGAGFAGDLADRTLRLCFVGYLVLLASIVAFKKSSSGSKVDASTALTAGSGFAFLIVGVVGGVSSGLLGIGGGLAITALLSGVLRLSQHQSQAVSLAVTLLPLSIPAVWVYVQSGHPIPWVLSGSVVIGLVIGTSLGALLANRLNEEKLRYWFLGLILAMAACMTVKALSAK